MSVKNNGVESKEVYAHRGASGTYFENTMKAFHGAVDDGADGIELDVQLSKDGVFFVIHDEDLNRVSGIHKNISEMDAADIEEIRIGKRFFRGVKGSHIPTLTSVVSFAAMNSIGLNIELKETVSRNPEKLSVLLEQLAILDNVHISSFDYALIKRVKELEPSMETGLLLKKSMLTDHQLSDYPAADAFHFHKRMLKEPYITYWKQTDKKIRVYGVEGNESYVLDPPEFIYGWITDYPSRFRTT
ncbi:glycerophosphodiester phosphodiesterase [Sporosarcina aquimarina]|uniref:Glycerophosphodiester phosphodiesterase family protein n=1 Tax=Sporosarcina aquimarina TaxID=114975 RepID=A0ABU4G2Y9_9BACL|nr:glycerophosphodiester phosphodiesterase family protein [Sporosarcina aquimarina]MDW0111329.1 glycerophosphodiester phosphodiesterase family protein [Sporosarcina aquimarina]